MGIPSSTFATIGVNRGDDVYPATLPNTMDSEAGLCIRDGVYVASIRSMRVTDDVCGAGVGAGDGDGDGDGLRVSKSDNNDNSVASDAAPAKPNQPLHNESSVDSHFVPCKARSESTKLAPGIRSTSLLQSFNSKIKRDDFEGSIIKKGDSYIVTFNFKSFFVYKDYFIKVIKNKLSIGNSYYVLIKVRYNIDLYKMAGKQFVFNYDNDINIVDSLSDLYDNVSLRFVNLMDEYGIREYDILYNFILSHLIEEY